MHGPRTSAVFIGHGSPMNILREDTFRDFCGFPAEPCRQRYPVPGAAEHAQLVTNTMRLDPRIGLDHGAWSVLRHIWLSADVPVFQLSIDWREPTALPLASARKLLPHWAAQFDAWVEQRLIERDDGALARHEEQGSAASVAVAMNDHYLPLLYTVGAMAPDERVSFTHTGFQNGSISMRCVVSEGVSA